LANVDKRRLFCHCCICEETSQESKIKPTHLISICCRMFTVHCDNSKWFKSYDHLVVLTHHTGQLSRYTLTHYKKILIW